MFGKNSEVSPPAETNAANDYRFTHDEIDLISECIKSRIDYYKGLLLLKEDWNAAQNEQAIAFIKSKLRILNDLQDRTTYIGQNTEDYR